MPNSKANLPDKPYIASPKKPPVPLATSVPLVMKSDKQFQKMQFKKRLKRAYDRL